MTRKAVMDDFAYWGADDGTLIVLAERWGHDLEPEALEHLAKLGDAIAELEPSNP